MKNEYQKAEQERKKFEKEFLKLQQENHRLKKEKEYEKDIFLAVENDVREYFFHYFEDKQDIEKAFCELSLLKIRDLILREKTHTALEGHYLDKNYEKILNSVYNIVKNDRKAQENLRPPLTKEEKIEKARIADELHQKALYESIQDFEIYTGTKWGNGNKNKELKKQKWITFFNMILK